MRCQRFDNLKLSDEGKNRFRFTMLFLVLSVLLERTERTLSRFPFRECWANTASFRQVKVIQRFSYKKHDHHWIVCATEKRSAKALELTYITVIGNYSPTSLGPKTVARSHKVIVRWN